MHEGPGFIRSAMAELVKEEGAEVPRGTWALPEETAVALRNAWSWNDLYWVDFAAHGFYGPYDSLSDVDAQELDGWNKSDFDEMFDDALLTKVLDHGKTVFSHAQTRGGCGSSESVVAWGGCYWSCSLDHGFSGPHAATEGALSQEALCVTGASNSIWCAEMTATEIVPMLEVHCDSLESPITINDDEYDLVDGKLVPYVEEEEDEDAAEDEVAVKP